MSGAGSSSRQFLSSVANNPRSGWLEYLGLPEDLDEWTVEDVRSTAAGLGLSAPAPDVLGAPEGDQHEHQHEEPRQPLQKPRSSRRILPPRRRPNK